MFLHSRLDLSEKAVSSGYVEAVEPVLRKYSARYIAPESAVAVDIDGPALRQLVHIVSQIIHRYMDRSSI